MIVFNAIVSILLAILAIPVFVLLVQVVFACFYKQKDLLLDDERTLKVAILMPAHNEALVIQQPIESILPQLNAGDKLIVIADNCTDDTASIARGLGASVIERSDEVNRGKGYALDFGLKHLQSSPPDILMIVDADCIVQSGTIDLLAQQCDQLQHPLQALYLMESQPNPSLKARIAQFAWIVKNKVRPMGFSALGLPCQLMGTGMAFLWEHINQVNLASGHIVEDMKLGTDLAAMNKAPKFLPNALVTSVFPPSDAATNTQRARWEHGHLSVILNESPKLIIGAIKRLNLQMLGMALDLLVPPLAMLTLLCCLVFAFSLVSGLHVNKMLSISLMSSLFIAVLLAWVKFGKQIISFKQLCYAPVYALIKIPLYIKFFLNRQVEWVRSKRD